MRRRVSKLIIAAALASAAPAAAEEALTYGPMPQWVTPAVIPQSVATDERPIELLLHDQQISVDGSKTVTATQVAMKVRTAEGLSAGSVTIPWQPSTEKLTINTLKILRGEQVIDVLASGQTFTTMRRETNLEAATLDGQLTANIQPEGLQVGDVILFATTVERLDPVLKDHVQLHFGIWNGLPIRSARAQVSWPAELDLDFRFRGGLPSAEPKLEGKRNILELELADLEPLIAPKGAPGRFQLGRIAEATNYKSWSQIAALMAPLYDAAAMVPGSGPLRDAVETIRKASPDPLARTAQALDLVQNRVRYVALFMGQGGYVPASAEQTWSRRYGDCKAKTALLMAILHELGIDAEPVAVHSSLGDVVPERLPMVAAFDHVLVRSRIAGKDYWLDGTRTGDGSLDSLVVPAFHWGLPLAQGAELVRIMPAPLAVPQNQQLIDIDATSGVLAEAPVTIEETMRGDTAKSVSALLSRLSPAQREQAFRDYAKRFFDTISLTGSSMDFDKQSGELRLSLEGKVKLDWDDSWYHVPASSLAFKPDFDRPDGLHADAPLAVVYPSYSSARTVIRLPHGFATSQKLPTAVRETLAGVEYGRTIKLDGDLLTIETSERSIVSEIAYKEALAAERRLKALANDDVYLRLPADYRSTEEDLAASAADEPASAEAFLDRGLIFFNGKKYDEAIADFTSALELDPSLEWALANRGLAYVWKEDMAAAERDLEAAEAIAPDNPVAARARGVMAEMKADFDAAIGHFSRSLEQDPKNHFALSRRANVYRALGRFDEALADSETALGLDGRRADVRLFRANLFRQQGKPDLAVKEADLLVAENSSSDFGLVAAGRIYAALGEAEKAMQAFDKALAIAPVAYIYVNRAGVRPNSDLSARHADIDLALKLEPDNVDALAFKASLLARQEKHDEALDLYDRILKDPPAEMRGLALDRAAVLHKAGRVPEAEAAFAAFRASAKTPSEFNNLCWSKATYGVLLESALEDCREALKIAPEAGAYLDSLGMVLLKLGRLDEALQAYDAAVSKETGSDSLMGRAFVHARRGDAQRAQADRAEAIALDPDAEARFADYGLKF